MSETQRTLADRQHALDLDARDPLAALRNEFHIPPRTDGSPAVYFCGHSLGLQPRSAARIIHEELDAWARSGVEGHFQSGRPWFSYHENLQAGLARLAGAQPLEVVAMNSLTVNLQLMLASFYRPTAQRHKLLIEKRAFSSDRYAAQTHIHHRGFDPHESLLEIAPREGEDTLRTEDILAVIEREGAKLATVMLPGVQFLTGQWLDMPSIAASARRQGSTVGFDLAHAIGNVPLQLHDWNADFAVWCSYKYLNAGPGAIGGCFVHERHARNSDLPRLAGWWGHDKASRFDMPDRFMPIPGAEGWQASNPSVFAAAPLLAALTQFDSAGIDALRRKSVQLTGHLETLLRSRFANNLTLLTPADPAARGCQLSIRLHRSPVAAHAIYQRLTEQGYFCDWREPDVIRVAPIPFYNTFLENCEFADRLGAELAKP